MELRARGLYQLSSNSSLIYSLVVQAIVRKEAIEECVVSKVYL